MEVHRTPSLASQSLGREFAEAFTGQARYSKPLILQLRLGRLLTICLKKPKTKKKKKRSVSYLVSGSVWD
ncbi:hypothetical protein N658DRAFT_498941 [Parathielavia hyrcaniae]|uniref:Uncharacterized protein n=1 Tax=Parathielavia hyrcaniae TaxID=113614 RepID=A0AAN6PVU7_9PEZI|nr:hypothetical protein N658DRAFT_498941 [Parathielavia hyrcaniae]